MIHKLLLVICFLSSFCRQTYAQAADEGLFIDPATIDFTLLQGQSSSSKITITNKLKETKQFSVYLNDWLRDSNGKHQYIEAGQHARSCANWLTLDKVFMELAPGETGVINVKMTLPDSVEAARQMRWSMIFVESVEEKKVPAKADGVITSIKTKFRVGVHVYQTPPTKVNKEVRMISFQAVEQTADSVYRIECQNTGDIQVRCKSQLELSNLTDGTTIVLDPIQFPLFPEQKRNIDFVLPKSLPKGKYTLLATVDAGEDIPLEAAQKVIEIN